MNELRVMISGTWVTCDLYKPNLTNLIFTNRTSGMIVRTDQSALTPGEVLQPIGSLISGALGRDLPPRQKSDWFHLRRDFIVFQIQRDVFGFLRRSNFLDFCLLLLLVIVVVHVSEFWFWLHVFGRPTHSWRAEALIGWEFFFSIIIWFCVFFSNSPTDCWEM